MKNGIVQVAYFLNGAMVNLLFYCHIILFVLRESESWKKAEFPEISIKMKKFKTFCETQISSRFKEILHLSRLD